MASQLRDYLFHSEPGITLYCGDCREVLPLLRCPNTSYCIEACDGRCGGIDLVLTDPPYGVSGRHDEAAITVNGHAPFVRHFGEWDKEWDPAFLLAEADRLLRPGGSLIAFMADAWIPLFHRTPLEQKKLGVWAKTNPAPRVRPGYQSGAEMWMWQVKPGATPTWNGGFTQSNVITTPNAASCEGALDHPTQKPLRLISGFVSRHSNGADMVLDPYMGSGTTIEAAKMLGRRAIGIEIEPKYCEIAVKRLRQEVLI
jgi:site-specific DNA-methyltransferase (adenine-specific)